MSDHVTEWLNAYLDGELKNGKLHQVESHLAGCEKCLAELESLHDLSDLLRKSPSPEFIPSERFAAQVSLRLPRELPKVSKRNALEVGWWLIPVGLLIIWTLLNASTAMSRVVSTAQDIGLLNNAPAWLLNEEPHRTLWSERLGEIGLLNGASLRWAKETEAFTKNTLPQIIWQAAIALVYLSWIALWWARNAPREQGRLLEG
jgi:anti-sigma factor RsiW